MGSPPAAADRVVQENGAIFGISGGAVGVVLCALGGKTDGTDGRDHEEGDFASGSAIEVDVSYGESNRVVALFEAELSECAMSTGEALSRWCAAVVGIERAQGLRHRPAVGAGRNAR